MIDLEHFASTLQRKPVAVFGLGLSGIATVKALRRVNVEVLAWDDNAANHDEPRRAGATLVPLSAEELSECACLVLAPGIPLVHKPHPVVEAARSVNTPIIGDIEILHRCGYTRRTIGVTGTNGKSTTSALIAHIINIIGGNAALGGNIGVPALALELPPPDGVFVLELSSYQLDLCPTFAPDIAVLLNVTPDHIDRHGSMENYIAAKEKIFRGKGDAVIAVDDDITAEIFKKYADGSRDLVPVSVSSRTPGGVYVEGNVLFDDMDDKNVEIGSLAGITTLAGRHNHQNTAAAYAAARLAGLAPEEIFEAIKTYPGLPHRQYPVRVINGVIYINDSKATNADSTAKALACHRNIYWILGGRPKEGGLNGLEPYMDRIRRAFLIGEAADDFAAWLEKHGVAYEISGSLDVAVLSAHRAAQKDRGQPGGAGTVLLSPACASFDQFKSFEDRGAQFTYLVESIEEEAAA